MHFTFGNAEGSRIVETVDLVPILSLLLDDLREELSFFPQAKERAWAGFTLVLPQESACQRLQSSLGLSPLLRQPIAPYVRKVVAFE